MSDYTFHILNVFAIEGDPFSGNPLAVFEDGQGLSSEQMQALARQFNLSETTFILPSETATAKVRIFTPDFEMPFAGHPTLGTAHVVRNVMDTDDDITLEMIAGRIPVSAQGNTWTLTANPASHRHLGAPNAQLMEALGLEHADLAGKPLWVDTGTEQLIVPLGSVAAVRRAAPQPALLKALGLSKQGRYMAQVFAPMNREEIEVRFFFPAAGGAMSEDPATGSACANLGGWFLAQGHGLPMRRIIHQGAAVKRPSRLELAIDAASRIHVSGLVLDLAGGKVSL